MKKPEERNQAQQSSRVEQKNRTHEEILDSASRLLRARGISAAGVSEVMRGAGLTVGGFYAHFASKEELLNQVLARTSALRRQTLFANLERESQEKRLPKILRRYLSTAHRDQPEDGCPLPAVVGDIANAKGEHRDTLHQELQRLVGDLEGYTGDISGISTRTAALGLIALMYGGLSIARALRGTEFSDEFLRASFAFGMRAARSTE